MKTNDKKLYEQIIYTTQGLSSKNTCKQPQSITTGDDISKKNPIAATKENQELQVLGKPHLRVNWPFDEFYAFHVCGYSFSCPSDQILPLHQSSLYLFVFSLYFCYSDWDFRDQAFLHHLDFLSFQMEDLCLVSSSLSA
jgi:hypothetical protein